MNPEAIVGSIRTRHVQQLWASCLSRGVTVQEGRLCLHRRSVAVSLRPRSEKTSTQACAITIRLIGNQRPERQDDKITQPINQR